MNNREFCYWLQGYFELLDADVLTNPQVQIIRRHINLAKQVDGGLTKFPIFLEGFFAACNDNPTTEQIQTIKRMLNQEFEHVIDPSYKDQKKLNQIHGRETVFRC